MLKEVVFLFCPNCGIENIENANFCINCGNNLKNIHNSKKNVNGDKEKNKPKTANNVKNNAESKGIKKQMQKQKTTSKVKHSSTINRSIKKSDKMKNQLNTNKGNINVISKLTNKFKESRENSRKKKEEKQNAINENINQIKYELKTILNEYEEYLIDKNNFRANLSSEYDYNIVHYAKNYKDTIFEKKLTREGFCGNITFLENYFRLLPTEKGKTTDIPYHAIRKIEYKNYYYKLKHCDSAKLDSMPFIGIDITLYLHDGNFCTINIFHSMNYPEISGDEYSFLYEKKYLKKLLELNRNKDKTLVLDLYKYAWNIGYEMNLTLKNHIKSIFDEKFNKNNVSVNEDNLTR